MNTVLPYSRLEQALATWPLWRPSPGVRPVVVEPLQGGLTNESWLVETDRGPGVVRLNSRFDRELAIDRVREQRIHSAVAILGNAPPIWFCDPVQGILVTRFIPGRVWQGEECRNPENRARLARVMAHIQKVAPPLPKFDYWKHLCHYEACLDRLGVTPDPELRDRKSAHGAAIKAFQNSPWTPVLVHHDLEAGNIIATENRLFILDWEYAALGYRGMDFPGEEEFTPGVNGAVVEVLGQLINGYWSLLKDNLASGS